ncbi:MAG: L,D-transpeptidase family protein [Ignavibacteria bacterium]|nr:L,D-transpeptidase family protein [Ignavibacteria bacterium]
MKKSLAIGLLAIFLILPGYYFFPEKKLDTSKKIDKIFVVKHKRQLTVYSNGEALKTYSISLGGVPIGKKEFEGDKKTPEGIYTINDKNPNSDYHLNLAVSYPNEADSLHALKFGKSAGGEIKIHGLPNGYGFIGKFQRFKDWTLGCIALTNSEIEELFYNVPMGTEIEIVK